MDNSKIQECFELLKKQEELSKVYYDLRVSAAKAKYKFTAVLITHLPTLRTKKKNMGIDMAEMMLLEPNYLSEEQRKEVEEYYQAYQLNTEQYKAIEKLLEINQTHISFIQSILKYVKEGETFGR